LLNLFRRLLLELTDLVVALLLRLPFLQAQQLELGPGLSFQALSRFGLRRVGGLRLLRPKPLSGHHGDQDEDWHERGRHGFTPEWTSQEESTRFGIIEASTASRNLEAGSAPDHRPRPRFRPQVNRAGPDDF